MKVNLNYRLLVTDYRLLFFFPSAFKSRSRVAQPSLTTCRPRPSAKASVGTSCVITEPEPT
jgi:hypothetical protein